MAGYGSLKEVQERWSLTDLMDALDVLDVRADIEQQASLNAQKGAG